MKAGEIIDKYKFGLLLKVLDNKRVWTIDTYSLVLRIIFIQMLIIIAAINKLKILQMDVKIAFLNCDLDGEVYMEQLKSLLSKHKKRKFVSLSNHCMVWNKHLNNGKKILIRLCCQMSLKSTKLINIFIWKTQIKVIALYASM